MSELMGTFYRIVTNGKEFKVQWQRYVDLRIGEGKKVREERKETWEDVTFLENGVALVPAIWAISGHRQFETERAAEEAAAAAFGLNRLRHREWRVA